MEKNITFTETIAFLQKSAVEINHGLCQDWLSHHERNKMTLQLSMLCTAIANLEMIAKDKDAQIFTSLIPY